MGLIILDNLLEAVKFFLILYYGFGERLREKKKWNLGGVIALFVLYSIFEIHLNNLSSGTALINYLIWICLSTFLVFKDKIFRIILFVGWSAILTNVCDGFSGFLFEAVCIKEHWKYITFEENIIADIVTLAVLVGYYIFIFRNQKVSLQKIKVGRLINISAVGMCYAVILSMIWDIYLFGALKDSKVNNMIIGYVILVLAAYYHIFIMIKYAIVNYKLTNLNEENSQLLFMQEQQYMYANQVDIETKKFRHDIKNHLLILSSLTKEKKWEEVDSYLSQMNYKISDISPSHYVNHSIADAIIRQFETQCREKSIQFKVKGYFPENCRIEYYDITTILTNILQNAYEAVLSEDKKDIKLEFRYDDKFFYIIEENTFDGNLMEKEDRFITRKKNKNTHGFGVSNIKESVKKYGGDYFYKISEGSDKNHRFQVSIVIPLKEKC